MDSSAAAYLSEEWLRTFIYEQGKEGGAGTWSDDPLLRLAEARAALRSGPRERQSVAADPPDVEGRE
jgi:hypothetical protein